MLKNINEDGFTLLEMLTALSIAAVLSAIAVPAFLNIQNQHTTAKINAEMSNALAVESGLCEIALKPDHTC